MRFMNKIVNPLVGMVLCSSLHGLVSSALLLISYHGRKSGNVYSLPVEYVQSSDIVYILPGMPDRKTCWHNLREGGSVQIILRGQRLQGHAMNLNGKTDSSRLIEPLNLYLHRFPASARLHSVRLEKKTVVGTRRICAGRLHLF